MSKLITMLGAFALMSLGAFAQDAADPAAIPAPAVEPAIEAPAEPAPTVEQPAPAAPAAELPAATTDAAAAPVADTPALATWEMVVFCIVVVGVIGLGIWKSGAGAAPEKSEESAEGEEKGAADYFLAGRGLSWWLVGFSLLAANISTEQFVGMSGQAADWLGLAIAGYEWLAAIVLVIVAFTFLPMLLKRGVFTIPQFLEERYNGISRVVMAIVNLLILVGVPTATVIYAGANVVAVYFNLTVPTGCIIIAACATVYVFVGGLKACAWTDLIWGAALIVGGGVVAYFAIMALGSTAPDTKAIMDTATVASGAANETLATTGSQFCDGMTRLWDLNAGEANSSVNGVGGKLHMMRPDDDPVMPWTVYLLGLWIPNFFYWGLNQYIMQRTLASKSLEEGQLGVVFAAFLKLLIPFVVIIPGILAYNLFRGDLSSIADQRAAEIVQKADETAATANKTVIYNVAASRLIRVDSAASATDLLRKNMAAVGADSSALDAKAAELSAVPAADTATRSAIADEMIKIEGDATKAARADAGKYMVTTSLVAYHYDSAFATLLKKLLPGTGWAWFVLAALFGAVVSSLASMLNSASTLFTMDIYGKAKEVSGKPATDGQLVFIGKIGVLVCALIATVIAPFLDNPAFGGIFTFIQEFQGFLSPGVLAVFLFGFFVPYCPRIFGWLGILLGAIAYAAFKWGITPDHSFLNRMAYSFIFVAIVGLILTLINKAKGGEAVVLTDKGVIEMKASGRAKAFGIAVIVMTIALYIIFW